MVRPVVFVAFSVFLLLFNFALAEGLVPCSGLDCTFCHFFTIFQNLFNFAVQILAPSVAVIGVAYGAYQFLIAHGNPDIISKGKKALLNTVVGFVIVYASYVIASTVIVFIATGAIGTEATKFGFSKGVFIFSCQAESPEIPLGEAFSGGAINIGIKEEPPPIPKPEEVSGLTSDGLIKKANYLVNIADTQEAVRAALQSASRPAWENGLVILVTSGYRVVEKQWEEVKENCDPGGVKNENKCYPMVGKHEACVPRDDGSNCPHVAGKAVDAWGLDSKTLSKCSDCQETLIKIMRQKGFCVLKREAWHFELESALGDREQFFDCG